MSLSIKESELKALADNIDALRKRRDDMLREAGLWDQKYHDSYILELDTQWPVISAALRAPAACGEREALERAALQVRGASTALNSKHLLGFPPPVARAVATMLAERDFEIADQILALSAVQQSPQVEGQTSIATKQSTSGAERSETETALAIFSALSKANIEHAALSCNGINLFGDRKSIDAACAWQHSHSQIDDLKTQIRHWREECGKLHSKSAVAETRRTDSSECSPPAGFADPTSPANEGSSLSQDGGAG